ncbi:MAG: FecR family protein, partial [Elusimicrobiota bacterium]
MVCLLLAALLLGAAKLDAAVTVSALSGNAFVLKAGSSVWQAAVRGWEILPSDQIRTGTGSRATLTFDDGSRIELGANGSFTLQDASGQASSIKLAIGSARAWVSKSLSRRFEIRTPTAVCSVRGTEFSVQVGAQGNTRVEMFTGLLAVADRTGNEVLLKDNQRIEVTERGLGPVGGQGTGRDTGASERSRDLVKREVGLEMTKEEVQAAAALEAKNAIYQQGKAIVDVNGFRVRIEEYIIRSQPDQFKLVVLNDRPGIRFDYFYYKGTFNTALPDDISIALRQLPGCIGAACSYYLTGYETARSNTTDNMLEVTSGGHQVDVNNNGVAADAVTEAFDPATDRYVSLAAGQSFYKTLFNDYSLKFNGVEHGKWAPASNYTGAEGYG